MALKSFAIPAPINGVTFVQYVQWLLDNDARAQPDSWTNARVAVRVEGAILNAVDTATNVQLTTYDWTRLKVLVNTADVSVKSRSENDSAQTIAARNLVLGNADVPFINAVNNAV
jgi:hypothetical protein